MPPRKRSSSVLNGEHEDLPEEVDRVTNADDALAAAEEAEAEAAEAEAMAAAARARARAIRLRREAAAVEAASTAAEPESSAIELDEPTVVDEPPLTADRVDGPAVSHPYSRRPTPASAGAHAGRRRTRGSRRTGRGEACANASPAHEAARSEGGRRVAGDRVFACAAGTQWRDVLASPKRRSAASAVCGVRRCRAPRRGDVDVP